MRPRWLLINNHAKGFHMFKGLGMSLAMIITGTLGIPLAMSAIM